MNPDDLQNEIKKIEGWLTDNEARQLFVLAQKCPPGGNIVEIGSWKGKSTVCLARGAQSGNGAKVYAVDPHQGTFTHKNWAENCSTFSEFKNNIKNAGAEEHVIPIVKTSRDAAKEFDKSVELIFIDGSHEYDDVRQDFLLWFPRVCDGGIMAFHDTTEFEGPRQVVREFLFLSNQFKHIHCVDSITFGQKIRQNSMADRVRNRSLLCLQNCFHFMLKLWLPKPIKKLVKKIRRLIQPVTI